MEKKLNSKSSSSFCDLSSENGAEAARAVEVNEMVR